MNHLLALIFACVTSLSANACAASDAPLAARALPPPAAPHNAPVERKYAVRIATIGGVCSATKLSPTVLLSAAHCFRNSNKMILIGDTSAVIERIIQDGNDHAMVVISGATLTNFATMAAPATEGDLVHYWGNAYIFNMLLRRGYVSGLDGVDTIYDINGYQGDSGSGIFNGKGQLVAVLSYLQGEGPFALMGSYPLNFTAAQVASVGLPASPYLSTGKVAIVNLRYEF